MTVKKDFVFLVTVLLASKVVTSIGCPSREDAMHLFGTDSHADLIKVSHIMWSVHQIGELIREQNIHLTPHKPENEDFWRTFFHEAEHQSHFGGFVSYTNTFEHSIMVKRFLEILHQHLPGIRSLIRQEAEKLDHFPTMKIGDRVIEFEKTYGVPFHECNWD